MLSSSIRYKKNACTPFPFAQTSQVLPLPPNGSRTACLISTRIHSINCLLPDERLNLRGLQRSGPGDIPVQHVEKGRSDFLIQVFQATETMWVQCPQWDLCLIFHWTDFFNFKLRYPFLGESALPVWKLTDGRQIPGGCIVFKECFTGVFPFVFSILLSYGKGFQRAWWMSFTSALLTFISQFDSSQKRSKTVHSDAVPLKSGIFDWTRYASQVCSVSLDRLSTRTRTLRNGPMWRRMRLR